MVKDVVNVIKTKRNNTTIFNFEEVVEANTDNEGFSVEFNEF
jgi:hypothetical protein